MLPDFKIGRCRLGCQPGHRLLQRQHLLRLAAEPAQGHGAVFRLLAADHGQHRHVGQAVLAHLGVDFLVGQVGFAPPARRRRTRRQPPAAYSSASETIVATTACTGASQSGKRAGILLDQDAEEAFEAAEDRPVQHHRPVAGAVLADIFGVQPFRQVGIDLQGAALPVAADGVAQHEFQLRAVERALAGVQLVFDAGDGAGLAQRAFGLVPELVAADARRSGRSENLMRKSGKPKSR